MKNDDDEIMFREKYVLKVLMDDYEENLEKYFNPRDFGIEYINKASFNILLSFLLSIIVKSSSNSETLGENLNTVKKYIDIARDDLINKFKDTYE